MTVPRTRPLKVGVLLPDSERELNGHVPHWRDIVTMARAAEDVGFDSIWITDHLIHREPGKPKQGMWECWSLLAALAAVTERVEIGPLVSCVGFRNPALLAKIADTVDEISGGRLILGLGAGWHEPEYRAFGYPFDHRVARFAEALTIITGLLREGQVDFAGTYYQARDCELRPRGPRPLGPPIMIGSTGPRMMALAARHADLWNAWGRNTPVDVAPASATLDAACHGVGRDPATLARSVAVLVDLPGRRGRPREKGPFLSGSPEELADNLRGLARAGVSHVQVVLDPNTPSGIEELAAVLEILDRG
ncbi:MAG: LLM class flavin-dependent oxidoreductase [Thermomicrobiales bacterium]|nr:LLM class flavin-dependent oxidoreductase [Thermomicrobiales bacterium]